MRRLPALIAVAVLVVGCAATTPPTSPSTASVAAIASRATTVVLARPRAEALAQPAMPARPPEPVMAARLETALIGDHCTDRDLAAPPASDVALTVLDRSYALPPSYVPPDLVPAADAGFAGASATKLVRSVLVDDLAAMRAAWEAAGLSIAIDSAYRSYAAQAATFDSWAAQLGYGGALVRSARAGHSEHQLGTALDVSSPGWGGRFGDWATETAEGAWMAAHAWEYGFVMSYPAGSQDTTCFSYEPWHYRWIGRQAAAAHRDSSLGLRPFLERYIDAGDEADG